MSKITEHNIEELMFDYVEGNLSAGEKAAVDNFVKENPEYAADLEAWKQSFVEEPEKDYPLADQLLAGSKGSIWMKWGLGLLLLGGSVTAAWWLMDAESFGTSDSSTVATEKSTSTKDKKMISYAKKAGHENLDREGNANGTEDHDKTGSQNDQNTNSFNGNNSSSAGSVTSQGSWSVSALNDKNKRRSGSGSSGAKADGEGSASGTDDFVSYLEPVPEISPYEVSGGYGHQAYVFEKLALFEALDYFKDNAGGSANRHSYEGTMDDAMEKAPTSVYRESFITKMMDKLAKKMQQPIGLVNLNDQYFILPDYHSPLYYNPAFAGSIGEKRFKLSGRARWLGSDNERFTGSVTYDDYIEKLRLGIGGTFRVDDYEYGMYRNYQLGLQVSPKFKLKKFVTLEPAIGVTLNQREANWNKIQPGRTIEYNTGTLTQTYAATDTIGGGSKTFMDFNAGLLLTTRHFYAGVSMGNILRPNVNVYSNNDATKDFRVPFAFSAQIGADYKYRMDGDISMSPHLIYNQIGNRSELWFGTYGRFDWFLVGASLSNRLDYVGMIGAQGRGVRVTYNFDMTGSSYLNGQYLPSHSISARFIINRMKKQPANLQYGLSGENNHR